jgi:hypothetical protein
VVVIPAGVGDGGHALLVRRPTGWLNGCLPKCALKARPGENIDSGAGRRTESSG